MTEDGIVYGFRYILEIYDEGSTDTVAARFEGSSPFMSLSKGDLINSRSWPDSSTTHILKVLAVEHLIWQLNGVITHHKMVFTEAVRDTKELRGI